MKKSAAKILFYGGLWGGVEASIGYLMHLFLMPFAGFLMFPLGFYFMRRAALETEDRRAPFYIALVAAAVKCVDLLLPNLLVIKVVNPAIGILLQGMAVTLFLALEDKRVLSKALTASFMWRFIFIGIVYLESLSGTPMRLLSSGSMEIVRYLTLDVMVNSLLIYGLVAGVKLKKIEVKPSLAFVTVLVALTINIVT